MRGRDAATTVPSLSRSSVAEAWGDWISGLTEWHLFGGLTYDQRRRRADGRGGYIAPGPDVAKAHVWRWLREAPKTLGRPIDAAVVALEYQRNGWPHFHPLLRLNGGVQGDELERLGAAWFAKHGYAKLEVPRDTGAVCNYAAKYLAKDLNRGDVIMFCLSDLVRAKRAASGAVVRDGLAA